MTVEEYKLIHPEHKDLEGDQLWDAMEEYMLKTGKTHEYRKDGRDRLRFPWIPENGDGAPVGIWDVVRNEELDAPQKIKWGNDYKYIIFDVTPDDPPIE